MAIAPLRRGSLSSVATVAAAGSVIANAAALTESLTVVTGADDTKGVVLPAQPKAPTMMAVYSSNSGNGLKVYPAVNATINDGSANAAVTIEGRTLAIFVATNSTNWACLFTANS